MSRESKSVLRKSQSNFAKAFMGLGSNQREAMEALYAYCRTVDDIVDESDNVKEAQLELNQWKKAFERWPNFARYVKTPVAEDLEWATQLFPIQKSDLTWILSGVEKDLIKTRYDTMEELLEYCDGVASAVGFCCMSIFEVDRKQVETYAFATGRALQLTNILRDIASDARRNRIYIPQETLYLFRMSDRDVLESIYSEKFVKMANHFAEVIDGYYKTAEEEAKKLPRKKIWPAEIMRRTYFEIFQKIRRKKFDIFSGKIRLSPFRKMWIALTQPKG